MAGTILTVCGQRVWLATTATPPPVCSTKSSSPAVGGAGAAALRSSTGRHSPLLSLPKRRCANARMLPVQCSSSPQEPFHGHDFEVGTHGGPLYDTIFGRKIGSADTGLQEWKEQEDARIAEMMEREGISIRLRPATRLLVHEYGPFEFEVQTSPDFPQNILEEIIWSKDVEVSAMKEKIPRVVLIKAVEAAEPARDFVGALRERAAETGQPGLIAEVKKASPSRGVIQPNFDPVHIAKAYEAGGAACLSVLTDKKYFQGSFENLKLIREAGVKCPLLCKEFIVDAWQLFYARANGADAVLLIAAVLPDHDLIHFSIICKCLGLAVLIEVHTPREMGQVLALPDVQMIGINNRNLATFEVDLHNTVELLKGEHGQEIRERDILVVGESGIFTPADIKVVQDAGVSAVLVGESLVKQDDPTAGIKGLFGQNISRHSWEL